MVALSIAYTGLNTPNAIRGCWRSAANGAKKNRPKLRHWASRYRARKAGAAGSHTFEQWMDCVSFYQWRCVYCGVSLTPTTLTKDHIVPLFKGGTNYVYNLAPACKSLQLLKTRPN